MDGAQVSTVAARGRRLVGLVAGLLAVIAFGGEVLAHSGLGAAGPAPGTTVGGEITRIELRYNSTVADVVGSVTDPDGTEIESDWIQDGNLKVTVVLTEPLSVPGEHTVEHTTTDVEDGDRVTAAYDFTFDPDAAPPQLVIIADDDAFPWIWVIVGVGVGVLAVLAWRLVRSLARARPTTAAA